jgi:hypothetical protein
VDDDERDGFAGAAVCAGGGAGEPAGEEEQEREGEEGDGG